MSTTTVGVFATRAAADKAVADLRAAGYKDSEIGLVAKDASGKAVKTDGAGDTNAGEGMAIGAAAGAATGAAIGVGVLAGVIPVIGPILALAPWARSCSTRPAGRRWPGWPGRWSGGASPNTTPSSTSPR